MKSQVVTCTPRGSPLCVTLNATHWLPIGTLTVFSNSMTIIIALFYHRPIEDSHSEAILHPSQLNASSPPGMLFGVYDGHAGASCGIVTANRLQHYVAAGLMSKDDVSGHLDRLRQVEDDVEATQMEMHSVLTTFNDQWEMVHDLKKAHQKSYVEYVAKMLRARVEEEEQEKSSSVAEKITVAFMALDEDMSKEAIEYANDDAIGIFQRAFLCSSSSNVS